MIGVPLQACSNVSTSEACAVHTHSFLVLNPSVGTLSFVCSFHAAAGPVHTPFGGNEINGPDGKLAQQCEQTRDYVCNYLVVQGYYVHGNCVCACVCVCVFMRACVSACNAWVLFWTFDGS